MTDILVQTKPERETAIQGKRERETAIQRQRDSHRAKEREPYRERERAIQRKRLHKERTAIIFDSNLHEEIVKQIAC